MSNDDRSTAHGRTLNDVLVMQRLYREQGQHQSTRRPPRGWAFWNGAWWPKRKAKREARKAMEQDGGFTRRDCYRWAA